MGVPAPGGHCLWPVWVGHQVPGTFGLLFVRQSDLRLKRKMSGCRYRGSGVGLRALKRSGFGDTEREGATDRVGYSPPRILSPVGRQAYNKIAEGRVTGELQKCVGGTSVEHRGGASCLFGLEEECGTPRKQDTGGELLCKDAGLGRHFHTLASHSPHHIPRWVC